MKEKECPEFLEGLEDILRSTKICDEAARDNASDR